MPNRFASGKYAIAECDRCDGRYMLKELRTQTVKTKPFKIKVCHECWDPDHPQLQLGMYPVNDPQAVREPRPDVSYQVSGQSGLQILLTDSTAPNGFGYPEAGPKAVVTGTPEQTPTLVVPLGERVRYTLTANDVVHGFWIPAFMIQMQNLPGVTNHLEFTANKLGEFPGRCNILCGRNHSQMLFTVKVVTPAEYDAYLETIKGGQA